MDFSPTVLTKARQAGFSDDELYGELAAADTKFAKAREQGFTLDEIASAIDEGNGAQVSARIGSGLEQAAGTAIAGVGQALEYVPAVRNASWLLESYGLLSPIQLAKDVGRGLVAGAEQDYGVDPSQNQRTSSKLIQAGTSVFPVLASGPLAPFTAAVQAGEGGRAEAEAATKSKLEELQQEKDAAMELGDETGTRIFNKVSEAEKALREEGPNREGIAFVGNAAVGAITEYLLGLPAVFRSINATGIASGSAKAIAKRVAWQIVKGGPREGFQESLQQGASNVIASDIARYEEDRPIIKDVVQSFGIGMVIGGGLSGVLSAANLPEEARQRREALSKEVSTTSLRAALEDEALLEGSRGIEGSPYSRRLIEEELLTRDPGYKAEEAGAPLTAEALREPMDGVDIEVRPGVFRTSDVKNVPKDATSVTQVTVGGKSFWDYRPKTSEEKPAVPTPTKSANPKPAPTATSSITPDWLKTARDQLVTEADNRGLSDQIEELSAQRLTAQQVAKSLGLDPIKDKDLIYAVRSARNIPSMDDATEFEAWLDNRNKTKGGDENADQKQLPNPEGTVENRDEQRQGQRQGDQRVSEGLRPDEGNAPGDSARAEERQDVEGGQRDELTSPPQTEPAPATESKGAELSVDPIKPVTADELAEGIATAVNKAMKLPMAEMRSAMDRIFSIADRVANESKVNKDTLLYRIKHFVELINGDAVEQIRRYLPEGREELEAEITKQSELADLNQGVESMRSARDKLKRMRAEANPEQSKLDSLMDLLPKKPAKAPRAAPQTATESVEAEKIENDPFKGLTSSVKVGDTELKVQISPNGDIGFGVKSASGSESMARTGEGAFETINALVPVLKKMMRARLAESPDATFVYHTDDNRKNALFQRALKAAGISAERSVPFRFEEAPKPTKALETLEKKLSDKRSELNAAKAAVKFDPDAAEDIPALTAEVATIQKAIAKEKAKAETKLAAQKPESKPQAESAPSPQAKAGGASSLQTISDVPAMEARIGQLLKQHKASHDSTEQRRIWAELEGIQKQLNEAAPDFTQATQEPLPEVSKEADETGTEFYSGIPLPKFKLRKFTPLDKATASRSAKLQKSEQEATAAVKEIRRVARTPEAQNAMTVYIEAGGNHSKLSKWHLAAKNKSFKKAALDAMRLTPEQEALADKIIKTFETLGKRGQTHGVLKSFRDNYVPHVWDLGKKPSGSSGSALQQNFRHAKARTFATIAEGDVAGFTPKTLEIGKILPAYMAEMNKVIADRQFVHEMARGTASDGRPLVVPRGTVKTLETDDGTSYLVNPRTPTTVKDAEGEAIETRDYRTMENQPALAGWKWKGKDEDGNPIFLRADLALHPDAYRRVTAMLGKSAIREWASSPSSDSASPIPKALVRGLDSSQAIIKREMFSLLAPFHQVQEGTHAVGHLINPFFGLKEANLSDPAVMDAAAHGLMLQQDRGASQQYMEGIGGERSFVSRGLGKLGAPGRFVAQEIIDGYQDYLFKSYIPRLKYTTYEAILKRNSKRYKNELASGEVTTGDIKLLSAEQTNAAYGHLNYALLDRNPTLQHLFQLGALAPDFLEARARFAGQAVKGLAGSKVGSEQFKAVVVLALAQAGIAYTLAQLTGGEWDKDHPFEMRYKGRSYTMRSVPEDLMLLGTQLHDYGSGKTQGVPFVSARINPTLQTLEQLRTGLNFRGEKTDLKTTLGEYLAKYIPITARALPGVRELTETSRNSPVSPIQQMAGSFGIKISRYSPITDAYEMANKWKKEQGIEEKQGTYPVSKYQPLRYALEDGDLEKAREKWNELRKKHSGHEIAKGFKASVTHAFTGSKENDRKLQQSLKPEDRAIFDEALRARQRILRAYVRMLESGS